MRSVAMVLCVVGVSGCATVSMAPVDATVETGLSSQQSQLRAASDVFCENAREAGWVKETRGIAGLARILMNGERAQAETPEDYAARINAETAPPAEVFAKAAADAMSARDGLASVAGQARAVLAGDAEAGRGDVMSFERTLVTAQAAYRAFARAVDLAAARAGGASEPAQAALDSFATEIDAARGLADKLAAHYAGVAVSQS